MRSGESVEPSARVIQVELPYPVTKKPRATNQACVFSMCTQRHLVQKGGARRHKGPPLACFGSPKRARQGSRE